MTQYLLSVWHDDDYDVDVDFDSPDMQRIHGKVMALNDELNAAGAWVFGGGLLPAKNAGVARYADGEVLITDGPYAESKEQIGGFWVIEAADEATARQWALKASDACEGPVELRPFQG
jgi:hypothetical protein